MSHKDRSSDPIKAVLWMLGATVGFCSMAVSGRELASTLDTFEIMMYRSVIGLFIVVGAGHFLRRTSGFRPKQLKLHLGRNICHFAGQNLWLFAMTLIPLAQVFAFEFFYPILVGLGAALFLGERFSGLRALTALCGFVGILIVAGVVSVDQSLHISWPENASRLGLITAAACSFGFAGSALFTKALTRTSEVSVLGIMFWMSLMQLAMGVACVLYDGVIALPSARDVFWLAAIAIGGLCAHGCLTSALQIAPASIVTPVDFLRLPAIALVAWLLYQETVGIGVILGASVIFLSNYANILNETRSRR